MSIKFINNYFKDEKVDINFMYLLNRIKIKYPKTFNFHENVIAKYITVFCELLAYYLFLEIGENNCEVFYLGVNKKTQQHFVIKYKENYIDISGIKTEQEIINYWNEISSTDVKLFEKKDLEWWKFYIENVDIFTLEDHEMTEIIAKKIVEELI